MCIRDSSFAATLGKLFGFRRGGQGGARPERQLPPEIRTAEDLGWQFDPLRKEWQRRTEWSERVTREERTTAGSSDRDTSRSSDGAQIGVAVDDDAPPPHVVRDADGVVAAAPASAAVANAPALLRRPTSLLLQRKSSSKYGKLVEDEEQEVSPQPGRFSTGANDDVS